MVYLGPVPLRAYALMIIISIFVAVFVTGRRLRARGMDPMVASEVAYWAVPFGIVGARVYHVVSTPDAYFGRDGNVLDVIKIWNGGLGIWGAIAGGAFGAWLATRRYGISLALFGDAAAPGIILAQAIGRWGNWFNQELYGKASTLPWAVRIDEKHQIIPGVSTYQPTFLYEFLWNLVVAGILLVVDRRHRLGRGKLFYLYVALYTFGRLWIEMLRIDTANQILGLRVNVWTSIVVCLGALLALAVTRRPVDPNLSREEQEALGIARSRPATRSTVTTAGAGAADQRAAGPDPVDPDLAALDSAGPDPADPDPADPGSAGSVPAAAVPDDSGPTATTAATTAVPAGSQQQSRGLATRLPASGGHTSAVPPEEPQTP